MAVDLVDVIVPTYKRPDLLEEALASIADASPAGCIRAILVGDDTPDDRVAAKNREVIAASTFATRTQYFRNRPSLGNYPNQWALASQVEAPYMLILHDDDHLAPGSIDTLVEMAGADSDDSVVLWFGRHDLMGPDGDVEAEASIANNAHFKRGGDPFTLPLWRLALDQTVPPNSFLIRSGAYREFMGGAREGNVGDITLIIRLANAGFSGSYAPFHNFTYRRHPDSNTGRGGEDVHYKFEAFESLVVPHDFEAQKATVLRYYAPVAARCYARRGERGRAWAVLNSKVFPGRLTKEGAKTIVTMVLPV
ncbi:glycosyltransferase family 2 protein [Demequina mangrovi]|uniref:Glycosyl transferase family 2 n=1 Tax=Demequina mangrovi TaxID=1043493 RepID=A0A1H6YI37_9MICO|nr:glycosyltransferase family 2 protein [Demequina mangrovi]SEJ40978.1 Glycosyl transferase family 2 [Demequina mangrovi]